MGNRKILPVKRTMCATCPWRSDSPYAHLREDLEAKAMLEKSRLCHSTGSNNAIHHRTGKPPAICRGARNSQLNFMHRLGFIDAPTDKAWAAKVKELGL